MTSIPVRSLRNESADVLQRVGRGERVTVTKDGTPVAVLSPVPRPPLGPSALVERFRSLPPVDAAGLRRDIDDLIDPSL